MFIWHYRVNLSLAGTVIITGAHLTDQMEGGEILTKHSRLNKILIRNQSLSMGPWQVDKALLGGLEFGFREILANGAGQKKIKN